MNCLQSNCQPANGRIGTLVSGRNKNLFRSMFFSAAGDDKTFAQVGKVVRAAADDDDDERLGQFLTVSSTST